ncbi:S8 family serine peptidase [Desmospora profundinema]|uniref:Minor extracellular serine protease Vpr n=1 Tax=Desmospora profundinema TaxID=1571184 RepID=A0ABU1IQ20_9BACL|nr:S8 family serine peptidase [Desmospora profundinema]MDR6226907.1 minor extracellular serine protease Vpr [Desmospora profundinema]
MKRFWSIALSALLVLAGMGTSFQVPVDAAKENQVKPETVKKQVVEAKIVKGVDTRKGKRSTVIVEMTAPPVAVVESTPAKAKGKKKGYRKQLQQEQRDWVRQVEKAIPKAKVEQKYDTVFAGAAVSLEGQDVKKLAEMPNVKRIYPVVKYHKTMNESGPQVGAPDVWKMKDRQGRAVTGKGVRVAVIDTGVDGEHPDLKGKVIGGYDFVNDDDDPMDEEGHGTHVAGTIAADGEIKGVAPDASILAYRVLDEFGFGTTDDVLAGVEQAVRDGADIMNLSLGAPINSPEDPMAWAMDVAAMAGSLPVVANGNDGPGEWTVGTPATSREAISVGASTKEMEHPRLTFQGEDKSIVLKHLTQTPAFPKGEWEMVDVRFGSASDFRKVNAKGKVALAQWGSVEMAIKARNAKAAGAAALIIYDDKENGWLKGMREEISPLAPLALTTHENGLYMKEQLKNGTTRVNLDGIAGTFMAGFSSEGPVAGSWEIKPDVVAPGVDIVSTIPGGGHMAGSGTSMAAPHVAGAAALIKQKHPNWKPRDVKASLANHAQPLKNVDNKRYPVLTQGAGMIQIPKAIQAETLIVPSNLSFGLLQPNSGVAEISRTAEVKNVSNKKKTYRTHVSLEKGKSKIQVEVPNRFTVNANRSAELPITMKVDTSLKRGTYSGVLTLKDGKKSMRLPFTVLVDPKGYPLVNGFSISPMLFSPNGDGKQDTALISYYLPVQPESLDLYAVELSPEGKQHLLRSEDHPDAGLTSVLWDGTDHKKKTVSDSLYWVNIGVQNRDREESTFFPAVLDREPPNLTIKKKFNKPVISGTIQDLVLREEIMDLIKWYGEGAAPVEMSWKKKGKRHQTWTSIPVMNFYEWEEELSFEYEFPEEALKPGKHDIVLKVTDAAGNETQKTITVTVPK